MKGQLCLFGKLPTVNDEFISEFLKHKEENGCTQQTIKEYKTGLRQFTREVPNDLDLVTSSEIKSFLDSLSSGSAKTKRAYLNSFFEWMVDNGYRKTNPMRKVPQVQCEKKEANVLTLAQMKSLGNDMDSPRDRAMIAVLKYTGARVGAIRNMRIRDVNFKNKEIALIEKGGNLCSVPMVDKLSQELREYIELENRNEEDYLFLSNRKQQISRGAVYYAVKNAGDRIGVLDLHPHVLRHSFASFIYGETRDVLLVKRLLNHKNVASTDSYIHFDDSKTLENEERAVCW